MGVEEEQRITVFWEVVGVLGDEQMVSGGDAAARGGAVDLRWRGGVAVARWSCGGAPPRLAWPRRRPVVEKELWVGEWKCQACLDADSGRCFI